MNIPTWLNDTVNVAKRTAVNADGAPTYGAASAVSARYEYDVRTVRAADGTERQVEHHVTTLVQIEAEDRVWMPGDSPSTANLAKRPVQIRAGKKKNGDITHYETRF